MLKLNKNKDKNNRLVLKKVYSFVLDFLNFPKNAEYMTKQDLFRYIITYIKENKLSLIVNGIRKCQIVNKLRILFDNCVFIARKYRDKKIILPNHMRYIDISYYLNFCFISHHDIFIMNLLKIFKNIFCEDIIIFMCTYLIM